MNNQINPAIIGAFVFGVIILVIFGILMFSSGQWFIEKERFVIYFDESVNGLNIGAPVKLSGVQIGKVTDIKVRFYSKTKEILTPVYIEIEPDKTLGITDLNLNGKLTPNEGIEILIRDGLRMQLQLTSLLTGQLFIEALLRPDTPIRLTNRSKNIQELPSIKSSGAKLSSVLTKALSEFQQIPFEELFADIHQTVQNIEHLTSSEETLSAIKSLSETLTHTNHLMQTLDRRTDPLLDKVQKTIATTDSTMLQMQSTLTTIESVIGPNSEVSQNLEFALKELANAARTGRILMDYLERHPEALIQGKQIEGDY